MNQCKSLIDLRFESVIKTLVTAQQRYEIRFMLKCISAHSINLYNSQDFLFTNQK